tara:strand:+ start:71 stop:1129 length:1059 start_codon:yes stop_codon:yes gene_type:complete
MQTINLGSRIITQVSSPYIIAEIGVNHEGSLDLAKKLIDLAKEGGADAAKFQSYKAKSLASKNSPSYWDLKKERTTSQYELFKKFDSFDAEEYISLAEHCNDIGIDFLSTPFDEESLDFLSPLVSFYKIASADITNIPFLRKVAEKNKPIVLSTGAATLVEIETALFTINSKSSAQVSLLHCILNYPTMNKDANLLMIKSLAKVFPEILIGYSDHTLPDMNMNSLITAFLLGAVILEKHFTHDKSLPGNDHYHSMDVNDLKIFKERILLINDLLGEYKIKQPIAKEEISRKNARRSIVLTKDLDENHIITPEDITCKRPGTGISPLNYDQVLGKKLKSNFQSDHVLNWSDLL